MSVALNGKHLYDGATRGADALVQSLIQSGCRAESAHGMLYLTDAFWTARQRQGNSLHEISYRACFKPQLPEFFITRLTEKGDRVFDPFMGRGTTLIQAALMQRQVAGSDQNPLCMMLTRPRLNPPTLAAVEQRLAQIDLTVSIDDATEDLTMFYHPETLVQINALKHYLLERDANGSLDVVDDWIRMVAINRLTGHSPGFFSVRTMPPNQAVSVAAQRKINQRSGVEPAPKDIKAIILKKTKSLLRSDTSADSNRAPTNTDLLRCTSSGDLSFLADASIALVVTSPPFLNAVDYRQDNWLRCWFAGIDSHALTLSVHASIDRWKTFVHDTFNAFTNTPLERSKVDGPKWIYASYALMISRKGISSLQLSKEIGVQQKTAWYMLHRLRLVCGEDMEALSGDIEIDETYIGGKESNKHKKQAVKRRSRCGQENCYTKYA